MDSSLWIYGLLKTVNDDDNLSPARCDEGCANPVGPGHIAHIADQRSFTMKYMKYMSGDIKTGSWIPPYRKPSGEFCASWPIMCDSGGLGGAKAIPFIPADAPAPCDIPTLGTHVVTRWDKAECQKPSTFPARAQNFPKDLSTLPENRWLDTKPVFHLSRWYANSYDSQLLSFSRGWRSFQIPRGIKIAHLQLSLPFFSRNVQMSSVRGLLHTDPLQSGKKTLSHNS